MSSSPMVEQVNRIVGNLLAWSGEVALPGIGSLYVERQAARRLSKRSVLPPSRAVAFTSQIRGESLIAAIAVAAQCNMTQAQDIYDRWLARTQEGDALTIEGVGVLKFKNFTLDPAFDRLLNPQGHEPVRIKPVRRFDWVLWLGVTVITLVAAGGVTLWLTDGNSLAVLKPLWSLDDPAEVAQAPVSTDPSISEPIAQAGTTVSSEISAQTGIPVGEQAAGTSAVAPAGEAGGVQSAAEQTPTAQSAQQMPVQTSSAQSGTQSTVAQSVQQPAVPGTPEAPAAFAAGRRYVVLGVFSTAENAARAIRDAVTKDPALRCSVYRFGAKLMVSPFDAADAEPCTQFIRDKAGHFPGMWTYTAK